MDVVHRFLQWFARRRQPRVRFTIMTDELERELAGERDLRFCHRDDGLRFQPTGEMKGLPR
jgi:hypothetical protein